MEVAFHRRRGREHQRVVVAWNGARGAASNLSLHATPRGRFCARADGLAAFVSDALAAAMLEAGVPRGADCARRSCWR